MSQLYNIAKDPGETTNLFAKYPDKVKQFQARMQYWQQQVRPSEEHHKIPSFPPMIYGEGEDALMEQSLIEKLKRKKKKIKDQTRPVNKRPVSIRTV